MRVLVLGYTGMLGNAVWRYLIRESKPDTELRTSVTEETQITAGLRWPNEDFKDVLKNYDGDYIINCIGVIPQRTDKFEINYELPIWLDDNVNCRVIHQDTNVWRENDYAKSKSDAARYIAHNGKRTKMLKSSIIGHDKNKVCLLDWFLNSQHEVLGYNESYWNGNTTLEWAKQVYKMMSNWERYAKCTTISTKCISKYELLHLVKEVYNKDIVIKESSELKHNRCLRGQIKVPSIREQLEELKEFYGN